MKPMTLVRTGKIALIGLGIALVYLFANGEQAAFLYQNF